MLKTIVRCSPILLIAFLMQIAAAPERATVQAKLSADSLQTGKSATIEVTLDVKDGFHAQSHKPLDENYIPTEAKLKPNPALTVGTPTYPAGETKEYPGLGKLSVYVGKAVIKIPITVKGDAPAGATRIEGSITYQLCDDTGQCFAPETKPFVIDAKIVRGPNVPSFEDEAPSASLFGWTIKIDRFSTALLAAFLAGIIFNVMPCVLPVLPLKVISFYEISQHSRTRSLLLSIVFGLGIIAVFGALALIVLVFQKITWGEWFSRGWFVWSMAAILIALGLGMFGAFSLRLPVAVYSVTPRHDTYTGNFLFGILAAVLSTPCTAPLFPPILLWGVKQPPALAVSAMLMVGVGMASPYVVLSAFPEVARRFPRTGAAAELVKQLTAFLLWAAAAYFIGGRLLGHGGELWLAFAVVVWAAVYLVIRTTQLTTRPGVLLFSTAFATSAVGIFLWIVLAQTGVLRNIASSPNETAVAGAASRSNGDLVAWQPYSDSALAAARAANKIVLVKFTASWCANCQYIEGTVYHDPNVVAALDRHGVIALKADLTDDGASGWPMLRKLSPAGGIPLTAIWSPGMDRPITLASIYTSAKLLEILQTIDVQSATTEVR